MAGTMLSSSTHYISFNPCGYCSLKIMQKVIPAYLEGGNECQGKVQHLGCHLERSINGDTSRASGAWGAGMVCTLYISQEKSAQRRNPNKRFDLLHNYSLSQPLITLHLKLGGILSDEGKKQSGFPEPCPGSWGDFFQKIPITGIWPAKQSAYCQWLLEPLVWLWIYWTKSLPECITLPEF